MSSQVLETLLTLNRAYQETIHEKLSKLNQLLEENQAKQNHILSLIHDSTDTKHTQSKLEIVLTRLKDDYLKNKFSATPPLTKDILRKKELVVYDDVPKLKAKWQKNEKKKLERAIIDDVVKQLKLPINNQLLIFKEKLRKAQIIGDDLKIIQFENEISKSHEELKKIDKMTDDQILEKFDANRIDWMTISNKTLDERWSANDCKFVWLNVFQPKINQKKWSMKENEMLIDLARKNKEKNWEKIARELNTGRSAYLCMKWYHEKTVDLYTKRDWTNEETRELIRLVQNHRIGSYIPYNYISYLNGRRDRHSVYCWYLRVSPNINRGKWSQEEETALLDALKYFNNTYNWKEISECVESRTPNQCREKFELKFVNTGKYHKWTQEEDEKLFDLFKKYNGSWVRIASELDNRNDHACLMRYVKLINLKEQSKWLDMQSDEIKEFIEFACKNVRPHRESDMSYCIETPNREHLSLKLLSGVVTKIKAHQDLIVQFIEQKRQGKLNIRILDTIGIRTPVIDALMKQAEKRQDLIEKKVENEARENKKDKENVLKEREECKKARKKIRDESQEEPKKSKKPRNDVLVTRKNIQNEKLLKLQKKVKERNVKLLRKPQVTSTQMEHISVSANSGPRLLGITLDEIDDNYKIPCFEEKSTGFKFLYSLKKNSDPKYLEKYVMIKYRTRVIALKPMAKIVNQDYLTEDKCKKIDEIIKKVCN